MKQGPPLSLDPRACDRCGNCLAACDREALKVGRTYLKVDWVRCDGCGKCAHVCARRAIVVRGGGAKGAGKATQPAHPRPRARPSADTPRSRSAEKVAKAAAKGAKTAGGGATGSAAATPKSGKRGGFQWTLLEAVAMLSVTFSAFVAKETLVAWPALQAMAPGAQTPVRVGLLGLYYVIQIAVLVWLVRRRGGDPLAAVGLRGGNVLSLHALTSAGLVVAGLVLTRVIASLYAYGTRELGLMPSATTDLPTLFGSDTAGFVLAVLMVVLVGPIVEEAVFRAALLEGLAAKLGAWPAIVAQALLFAAFHRSVWLLFPTFVLGIGLGWLAHERESLWRPIIMHGLYNAITVAAAFLVM